MAQRAGDKGLPMGLPRSWDKHRWPRQKVCIFNAVVNKDGISLMSIFRVTFRRRNVRPLDEVPRVVESAWVDREDVSIVDIHVWTEKVKQHAPGPQEALLIKNPARS